MSKQLSLLSPDFFPEQNQNSSKNIKPLQIAGVVSCSVGNKTSPKSFPAMPLKQPQQLVSRVVKRQSQESHYLTDRQVAVRFGVSRPTIWRWLKCNPMFPAPVSLSSGCKRWWLNDLLAFEEHIRSQGVDRLTEESRS